MATPRLIQVVSYIDSHTKKRLDEEIRKSPTRLSVSAYIDTVLRQHLHQQKAATR